MQDPSISLSLSQSLPHPPETLSWLLLLLFAAIGSRCAHYEPMCLSTEKVLVLEKKARKLSLYRSCYHYRQFSSVPESRLTKRSSLFSVFNSKKPRGMQCRRADLVVPPPLELLPSTPFHLPIAQLVSPSRAVFVQTCYRNHSVVLLAKRKARKVDHGSATCAARSVWRNSACKKVYNAPSRS